MNNFNYKNLCPFKWFVLQNFPFIEADFDAITNWQLFCKLGEEMNKIIEKVNQAGVQTENLTNAFIDLQNYVNDYFENLDVQDEINNKLDEMAEGGELAEIINQEIFQELNRKIDLANSQLDTLINNYSDIFTNTNNKFVMIGDSIAEGYGWWGGNSQNKNNNNDGLMSLLRNDYPNSSFTNLSVSGSTIANITGHPNLQTQITNVPNNTTHCFIMTGINDVTVSMRDNANYIGYPTDKVIRDNYISNDFSTTCSAFESCITNLLQKNNDMKIYLLIDPTIDYDNYNIYDMCFSFLKFIADKYGVNVIDFRQMFRKYIEPYSSQYFYDKVHPNQNGYRLMYPYFRNHIRFDINDNFKELPPCLIVDTEFDFGIDLDTANSSAYNIARYLGALCPLWQQNFETIVINANNWGADINKVVKISYTFNYQFGKLNIESLRNINSYSYTFYIYSNKYSNNGEIIVRPTWNSQNFSEELTDDMNITDITQMKLPGIYRISYSRLPIIEHLISDLKSSNNGWAICEVITYDANNIIQKWTSFFKRDYIYYAYITNANTDNPGIVWKKIPLNNT